MNSVNGKLLIQTRTGRALRVLVVDDDFNTRDILAEALGLFGADVRGAADVAEARAQLAAWRPDLLLSDLGMPAEDGYDLIRQLRALTPAEGGHLPALALTGYTREEKRNLALECGYNEVLTKPAELEELLDAIRRVTTAELAG
jgi:CheY-like chemotaxis protein